MNALRVFTCDDHDGHWDVGTASVIVARDEAQARELLNEELTAQGLSAERYTLTPLDLSEAQALVLRNGEY